MAVSAYNIKLHYTWVKEMKNTILLNGIEFHSKFFKSIMNGRDDLNELRNEIIDSYIQQIPDFSLKEFEEDLLFFPNFKEEGTFEELDFRKSKAICIIF